MSTVSGRVSPTRYDDLLLERAQELDLQLDRHLADLVEEQRAAVGRLELALLVRDRAGERALDVAEQLALEQVLGDRAAVDRDERLAGARRAVVDLARDQLLAGAGLAGDQHRDVGRRDLLDLAEHLLHRRRRCRRSRRTGTARAARCRRLLSTRSSLSSSAFATISDACDENTVSTRSVSAPGTGRGSSRCRRRSGRAGGRGRAAARRSRDDTLSCMTLLAPANSSSCIASETITGFRERTTFAMIESESCVTASAMFSRFRLRATLTSSVSPSSRIRKPLSAFVISMTASISASSSSPRSR